MAKGPASQPKCSTGEACNTRNHCSAYCKRQRVLEIETKLQRWASNDPHRQFDDLFNPSPIQLSVMA
jgi:hypothetical protein